MIRAWEFIAGITGALSVALGAYATHALSDHAQVLADTASRYGLYHALALLAVARMQRPRARWAIASGALFVAGLVLFCGGLTVAAIMGWGSPTAPIGGTCFILGWLSLGISGVADHREE